MKIADALMALQEYYDKLNPTADDGFIYTEALGFLIEETKDPRYMCELGWYYSSHKRFDLEIKYLEMAAEYEYLPATEELGYMWYYGQHGEQDYDKAFKYFSMGAERDPDNGSLWCRYKLADMYHYGYSVKKDEAKYRKMIEEAYEDVKNPKHLNDPFPEICLRLAGIRAEENRTEEAVVLLKEAKPFLAERLSIEHFWGHIEVMGRIVKLMYELTPFDVKNADFYDLFYLTETPGEYSMTYRRKKVVLEAIMEDGEYAVGYDGRWYRSFGEFCQKAEIDKVKFTSVYDEFRDVEVE